MTLTNRLSLFFLTTLAVVLVGFSATLYSLASAHLHRQAVERLEFAVNTLAAAAEVGSEGVEWEPGERQLTIGSGVFGNQVAWCVSDEQGRRVDHSAAAADAFLIEASQHLRTQQRASDPFDWQGGSWLVRHHRLAPPVAAPATRLVPGKDDRHYSALTITAGVSLEPLNSTLRQLASVLVGLSLAVWLVALFVGRAVCRRALLPVRHMAVSAREMDADDLGQRLTGANTGDELEDLSRSFNNLLDRLQESFQRQQRFTGDASHQLRTPLTAILGQIEVALRRQRTVTEYEQVLTTVHQKAEQIRRIVESLLFLARADAETHLPDHKRINLKEWLPVHLQSWADLPRASDVLADDVAGVDAVWVKVQPVLLGELLNILFDNACKYSRVGTPIMIRLRSVGATVELLVQDEGCGIMEADQPHLFTPFFRTGDSRRRGIEGLGLGLAIAKRLAAACGGGLSVTSHLGQGSCFTLRLPMVEPTGVTAISISDQG